MRLPCLCRWFVSSLLLAAGSLAGLAAPSETAPGAADSWAVRVAITVQIDGQPASELQDELTAALSSEPRVELVERSQIDLLLQEDSLRFLNADSTRRERLGRLLALDYFLNFRAAGRPRQWIVEAVNAQTGSLAASASVPAGVDDTKPLALAAAKLVSERLLHEAAANARLGSRSVAVLDLTVESPGDNRSKAEALRLNAEALRLSAGLRSDLGNHGGLVVLDRALTQQVALEQAYGQEALTEPRAKPLPLLGADFLVSGKLAGTKQAESAELTVLATRGARTLGTRSFPLEQRQKLPSILPEAAQQWLVDLLHVEAQAPRPYRESIQIEALEPFYLGITLFSAGRYLDAADAFQNAYDLNEKFRDAMLWEARCYDALGLEPLARMERRFVELELTGRGFAAKGTAQPDDAVTFLGITGPTGERVLGGALEIAAIDLLASIQGKTRLQLASHLARFRDEYDALVGSREVSGPGWSDAPEFVSARSLRGAIGAADAQGCRNISWSLVDNLSARILVRAETKLGPDAKSWRDALKPTLAGLWQNPEVSPGQLPTPAALPKEEELVTRLRKHSGREANAPLLGLALCNPENPMLPGHTLSKDGSPSGLDAYLNFGLREYLLARIRPENPLRPWLELQRIIFFLPLDGTGKQISGKDLSGEDFDPHAALERFCKAHPTDLPGCLAEYLALYDRLSQVPPAELAQRFAALKERLEHFSENDLRQFWIFPEMVDSLRYTALIATGNFPNLRLPMTVSAHRLFIRFDPSTGKPMVDQGWGWRTSEWQRTPNSMLRKEDEARASLAILGRGDELSRVRPEWLEASPHSVSLCGFVIDCLHESNWFQGRPFLHEFDAAAERRHYHALVDYCRRVLVEQLDATHDVQMAAELERWCSELVRNLCDWGFQDTVTDAEYDAIRDELATHFNKVNKQFGRTNYYDQSELAVDWRKLPRHLAVELTQTREVWNSIRDFYDPKPLLEIERAAGQRSWQGSPIDDPSWTQAVHDSRLERTLTCRQLADVYLRYLPLLPERLPGPDYNFRELAFLLDFGSTLLGGGEFAAAESVYSRIVNSRESDLNQFGSARELRASASLGLALICRASGRKAEALTYAQRALLLSKDQPFRQLIRYDCTRGSQSGGNDYSAGNGRALALRLSEELRGDAESVVLPLGVKSVVVHTPNFINSEVTYYYCTPVHDDPRREHRVLLLIPSGNDDALEYCQETNAWARFADEHGLVLVAPKFLFAFNWGTPAPAMCEFQHAQVWSGQATLDALERIRAQGVNIALDHLLLHGYGAGAQFAQRFARWAPERCAAVSIHSTQMNWAWYDWTLGMKPLSSLKSTAFLATAGQLEPDDRDAAAVWVTMARGASVPVIWKELPAVAHNPSREMEELSRAFLALYSADAPSNPQRCIGDLRSWTYFDEHDPRVAAIPENLRQELPSPAIAQKWGSAAN